MQICRSFDEQSFWLDHELGFEFVPELIFAEQYGGFSAIIRQTISVVF